MIECSTKCMIWTRFLINVVTKCGNCNAIKFSWYFEKINVNPLMSANICVCELNHHWFNWRPVACSVSSHCFNQYRFGVNRGQWVKMLCGVNKLFYYLAYIFGNTHKCNPFLLNLQNFRKKFASISNFSILFTWGCLDFVTLVNT